MRLIEPWFRARQGEKARVASYKGLKKPKWLRATGKLWLDDGYPVVFGFYLSGKAGHFAVATKYRTNSIKYHHCKTSGRGFGKKTRCTWKTAQEDEFFLHYGWGGKNNQWQKLDPFSAHVAYIRK